MGKRSVTSSKLRHAVDDPSIYRISRRSRFSDRIDGFVVGVGKRWVLVAPILDGGYPDGLVALRVRDVSKVRRDKSFQTVFALRQPRRDPAELSSVDLDDTSKVLRTLSALSRLVAVERLEKVPDALWIGEYVIDEGKWFWLWEVRPNATWHPRPLAYRVKTVTAVSIDNHYLTALDAVAMKNPRNGGKK